MGATLTDFDIYKEPKKLTDSERRKLLRSARFAVHAGDGSVVNVMPLRDWVSKAIFSALEDRHVELMMIGTLRDDLERSLSLFLVEGHTRHWTSFITRLMSLEKKPEEAYKGERVMSHLKKKKR